MALRTPLEVALGTALPLDFNDLLQGDYDVQETTDEAREAALLSAAMETGDVLMAESALDAIAIGSRS